MIYFISSLQISRLLLHHWVYHHEASLLGRITPPTLKLNYKVTMHDYKVTMTTSHTLILAESVRNMVNLSIPIPHPPVGGKPYSRAVQKFSSIICASSSPASLSYKETINDNRKVDLYKMYRV